MQTNTEQAFELLEANLERLQSRLPEVPINAILLCRLLMHVGREMSAMFEQQIRPAGLADAEFRVLTTLYSQPAGLAYPSELCARTTQSPANMSRISDALVARNLITRELSAQDRRRMLLQITPAGEALVRDLLPAMFEPLRDVMRDLGDAEQRQLIEQLKHLGCDIERVSQRLTERQT